MRRNGSILSILVVAGLISSLAILLGGLDLSGDRLGIADPDEAVREEILAELRQYYADFSERDWTKFSDHFWSGATLTTVWQLPGENAPRVVTISVPEFVEQAPQGPGSKPVFEEKMTGAKVRVIGNLAQVWATYEARFGDPGNVQEWNGIDAFTLMKHNGRWRITSLAYAASE